MLASFLLHFYEPRTLINDTGTVNADGWLQIR